MPNGIRPKGKHGLVSMDVPGAQTPCPYCKRPMIPFTSTHPTKDHVVPKSKGGRETIIACSKCNNAKGNMMPDEWAAFMARFPNFWAIPGGESSARRTFRGRPIGAVPKTVPIEYPDDPKMQAAFENIYRDRLYLLRLVS
jgi:hypothetical protein